MINEIALVIFVCSVCCFTYLVYRIFAMVNKFLRLAGGYLLDEKVDKIILKSTLIGELQSFDKAKPGVDRVPSALEKSMAIASDVLLQNGISPREYNLVSLVMLCRYTLNLKLTDKGVMKNGSS